MKVTYMDKKPFLHLRNMNFGQLGKVKVFGITHIVLRTGTGALSLTDPDIAWLSDNLDIAVELLADGETVTLTQ